MTAIVPTDCPKPGADFSCRFCGGHVHRGDSGCGCSTLRQAVTYYASLCLTCADAVDALSADTPVGRVHRALVHQADVAGRPSGDD